MRRPLPRRPLERLLVDSVLGGSPSAEPPARGHRRDDAGAPVVGGPPEAASVVRDAAHLHRVTPAVFRYLAQDPAAPRAWLDVLRGEARLQAMRHLLALADLAAARLVLTEVGCPWVAVKGPVAAECIWPSPGMREYYDIDVVVDRRRFAEALDALLTAGFTQVDRNWPLLLTDRRAEIELLGPHGTAVDLHWDIAVPRHLRSAFATDVPGMLDRAVPRDVGTVSDVPVLDPVDTAVHLVFHAAQAGANRLMWVADIRFAAARPGFDWDEFARRVRRMRFEVPAALVLGRVGRTLGFAEPPPPAAVLAPGRGLWGTVARLRDRRVPFPGLPGDRHLGGSIYGIARRTTGATLVQAARHAREVRRGSRLPPGPPPLHADVPDPAARREYLEAVTRGERP